MLKIIMKTPLSVSARPLEASSRIGLTTMVQGQARPLKSTPQPLRRLTVDLQQRNPDTESTTLHWAIRVDELWTGTSRVLKGHGTVETLLKAGASMSTIEDHLRTPRHIATYSNDHSTIALLLASNENPNFCNSWELTRLSIAQSHEEYLLSVKLMEAGAVARRGANRSRDILCGDADCRLDWGEDANRPLD